MIFLGKVIYQPSSFQVTNLNRKEDQSEFSYSFSLQRGFQLQQVTVISAQQLEIHICIWTILIMIFAVVIHLILFLDHVVVSQKGEKQHTETNIIGCLSLPSSQKFFVGSYFKRHDSNLVDSDFEAFLAKEFMLPSTSSSSCKLIQHNNMSDIPGFSITYRNLSGDGSHRHLVTTVRLDISSALYGLHTEFCKAVVIERLPEGVFADPFELQHLVQRNVFSDASVFGDTNLELPTVVSNRSVVEVHRDIWNNTAFKHSNRTVEFVTDIPLHARYPALDSKGYSRVVIEEPDLMLLCMPKSHQHDNFSSMFIRWKNIQLGCPNINIAWEIPCGDDKHTKIVSIVTFVSALISSLLIVSFSLYYSSSSKNDLQNA